MNRCVAVVVSSDPETAKRQSHLLLDVLTASGYWDYTDDRGADFQRIRKLLDDSNFHAAWWLIDPDRKYHVTGFGDGSPTLMRRHADTVVEFEEFMASSGRYNDE
jgi:hypothetical protein